MVVQGKCSSHCAHKEGISTKKVANKFETIISYKSLTVRTQYVTDKCTEQSPFWEAHRFSASQETPSILWNLKFHYQIYKPPQTVLILIQINPVHASQSHFLKFQFNSILPFMVFQVVSFPQASPSNPICTYPVSHACHISGPSHSSFYYPNIW